jgi:hypothetical protein
MKNAKKKKIFMGLGNIAGYFSNLKDGFDQIGEQSYHLNVDDHVFVSRETDSTNVYIRLLRYLYGTRSNKKLGKKINDKGMNKGIRPRIFGVLNSP